MKTYRVKNYKGNLVESLSKFQKKHKRMKIIEAVEDGDDLKIKAEESEKIEEADEIKDFVAYFLEDSNAKMAIDTIQKAMTLLLLFRSFQDDNMFEGALRDLDSLFSVDVSVDLDKKRHPERSKLYDKIASRLNGYKAKIRQNLKKFAKTSGKKISRNIWSDIAVDD